MNYQNLVEDFAQRTRVNLEQLRSLKRAGGEVYEVTALLNSMLGLLVFPKERYVDRIPKLSLSELEERGWPIPEVVGDYPQVRDLQQLVRYLRNAISHFNVEFYTGDSDQIQGMTVWNTRPNSNEVTWRARLTTVDLEKITDHFIALILEEAH